MLLQFTFENYKSFKDETTLDMMASSIKDHESDVAVDAFGERVLKVAAIFGANASGKSNVFKAFEFMMRYIKESFGKSEHPLLRAQPFSFIANSVQATSSFEIIFSVNGDIFQYGFTLDPSKIHEEYLYKRDPNIKKEKYLVVFYRGENGIEELMQELEPAKDLLKLLDDKVLSLSMIANFKFSITQTVFQWFNQVFTMNYGESLADYVPFLLKANSPVIKILHNPIKRAALERFVQAVDTGIAKLGAINLGKMDIESEIQENTGEEDYGVVAFHKNIDSENQSLVPISEESSGTRKLIALYVHLEQVLESGGVLFADELDAKLHPLLLRYLINMFHDPATNPKNAQLIFTTHDVFTLDKDNFRRDEIWFVDKDERGVSELYSLAEYKQENGMKTRNDASYGKDYILGKYNAIPNLKRLTEEGADHGE